MEGLERYILPSVFTRSHLCKVEIRKVLRLFGDLVSILFEML